MDKTCDEHLLKLFRSQLPYSEERHGILSSNGFVFGYGSGGVHTKDEFDPQDDDIFLVSYPKSGTTWACAILSLIASGGNEEPKKRAMFAQRVNNLVYFSSFAKTLKVAILNLDLSIFIGALLTYTDQLFGTTPPPGQRRIISTHLLPKFLPKATQDGKHKIIYITRNVKDNMVSFYHYYKTFILFNHFDLSWNQHFEIFMSGKGMQGSWWEHVQSYCKLKESNSNVLVLKYEDLKKDVPAAIEQLATFVGVKLDRSVCEKIAEMTDLKTLKTSRQKNNNVGAFTRKGVVGDWKNHFTVAQNRKFHEVYGDIMREFPIRYDYE